MPRIRIGVQLPPQHTSYAEYANAVRRAEDLGADTIFNWDHFFPLSGPKDGLHFEGWSLVSAMATLTTRAEIGCLVTCNSYRNPNLQADIARTIDHISGGRLIFGIGSGWKERDYTEYGYEFGTAASRLKALARDLPIIKARLQQLNPPPLRNPLPILIGGGGEKVTLKITAQHADLWNTFGPPEKFAHKNAVLTNWCEQLGRDPASIERTVTINPGELGHLDAYVAAGAQHFIMSIGAPFEMESLKKLIDWRDAQE